jgi:hypothetical protein
MFRSDIDPSQVVVAECERSVRRLCREGNRARYGICEFRSARNEAQKKTPDVSVRGFVSVGSEALDQTTCT